MKKSMKKLFLLMAVVITVVVCLAFSAGALDAEGQCGDNVYWSYDESTGKLVIRGKGDMWDYGWNFRSPFDSSVKNVVIGNGVTSIGSNVFDSSYPETITVPKSVTEIDEFALYFEESVPCNVGEDNNTNHVVIYCYRESVCADYAEKEGFRYFLIDGTDEDFIFGGKVGKIKWNLDKRTGVLEIKGSGNIVDFTDIAAPWYKYRDYITKVKISDGITGIGDGAFCGFDRLSAVTIPEGVTYIGDYAFQCCHNVESITIPAGVTNIGDSAFSDCLKLKNVTIPDSVKIIDNYAFEYCENLKSVTIGNSVISIGSGAFASCNSLNKIVIPNSVKTIGTYIFEYCYSLKNIVVSSNVGKIVEGFVSGCGELETVTIYNPNCSFEKGSGLHYYHTIIGFKGSTSESFAESVGAEFIDVETVHKHTYKTVPATKATLTSNGKTETKCPVCGKVKSTATVYSPTTFTLSTTSYTHNGSVRNPGVTVKDSKGKVLVKGTDYKVTYENGRILPGKYTVRIDFIGKYEGTKRLYFTIAPKTPGNVKTAQSASAVRLNWSKVTGASGYIVEQYVSGAWKRIATITKPDTITYRVEKLKSGTTYKFRIKAYKKDDGTIWSKATSTITAATNPAVPKSISTSQSTSAINIKWGKVTGANGYIVEQYVSGAWKRIKTVTKADTVSYKVQNLKAGTTYKFRLKAYKKVGDATLWSGATSTITVATKPATPSVTSIASPSKGKVTVRWSNVTGETGYEVYYSTSRTSGFKKIANFKADTLTASKTGLTSGKTFYFKVRAYKTVGSAKVYSSWSAVKGVKVR